MASGSRSRIASASREMRHEEVPAALAIQPRRDLARAESVAIRLDYPGDRAGRVAPAQQAPVGGDGVKVDFQDGGRGARDPFPNPLPQGEGAFFSLSPCGRGPG